MYINIHTHHTTGNTETTVGIQSLYSNFAQASSGMLCSLGLHPWYLENHLQLFQQQEQFAVLPNVLAIGECGLDKLCQTDWNLQVIVFKQQIELANRLNKPLIIHCVRAFDELLRVFKETPPAVPVIVHGFNKKGDIAERLLNKGIYISFGAAILKDGSPAAIALKSVPADRFFPETDSAVISIRDIYKAVATVREIEEEAVILQIQQNFATVFKYNT